MIAVDDIPDVAIFEEFIDYGWLSNWVEDGWMPTYSRNRISRRHRLSKSWNEAFDAKLTLMVRQGRIRPCDCGCNALFQLIKGVRP